MRGLATNTICSFGGPPHDPRGDESRPVAAQAVLVLMTPFTGQAVLLTGGILAALVGLKLVLRGGRPQTSADRRRRIPTQQTTERVGMAVAPLADGMRRLAS